MSYQPPTIKLPIAPDGELKPYLDELRRGIEFALVQMSQTFSVSTHRVDFINPKRHGYGLPVGATWIDGDGIVRIVQAGEGWAAPVEGRGRVL